MINVTNNPLELLALENYNKGIIFIDKHQGTIHEFGNEKISSLSERVYYLLQIIARIFLADDKGFRERMYNAQKSTLFESRKSTGETLAALAWNYDPDSKIIYLKSGANSGDTENLSILNREFDNLSKRLGAERALITTWISERIMKRGGWRPYQELNLIRTRLLPGRRIYTKEYSK